MSCDVSLIVADKRYLIEYGCLVKTISARNRDSFGISFFSLHLYCENHVNAWHLN